MTAIPIQNIFFMFCYAWQHFKAGEDVRVGADNYTDLLDLLTEVVVNEASSVVRRGLESQYITQYQDLAFPKGKILIGESIQRNLIHQKRLHCAYDDLSHNILHNQIIKTTLERLMRTQGLSLSLKDRLKILSYRFQGVDTIELRPSNFQGIRLHRHNAHYRLLLKLCELLYWNLLPQEMGQDYRFKDLLQDEVMMSKVFEDFVRNFFAVEQSLFKVGAETIYWNVSVAGEYDMAFLPDMHTDICLTSPSRKIVIDTKYYQKTLGSGRFGMPTKKIQSGHLYQIFSYLKNLKHDERWQTPAEGILLYPAVDEAVDLEYVIQGHKIRICTIDLNQHWRDIKNDLLSLIA